MLSHSEKRRGGVNEVIKDSLYQRGHFLTWPHSQKQDLLNQLGITCVVNLWYPIDSDMASPVQGMFYLNWHIGTDRVPSDTKTVIRFVASLMKSGNRVLVHCEAGVNRSVWFCGRLVAEFLGCSGQRALDIVTEAVPRASLSRTYLADLMGVNGG